MQRSETIAELITALSKAQSEFTGAVKDSENPAFHSKYADLASVVNAVRPALNKYGIVLLQISESDLERQTASITTSLHFKEEWMSVTAEAPAKGQADKFNVQTLGATWTYLKRYTLQGLLGIPSEDDDGNSLANNSEPIPARVVITPEMEAEYRKWKAAFDEQDTVELFNQHIVPLMRERGKDFIKAAAQVAKERGWKPNRTTGLYEEHAKEEK